MPPGNDADSIRLLNDAFRRSFSRGRVLLTANVAELPEDEREAIMAKVRAFEAFDLDNDPHGEHLGTTFFWKIDCYVPDLRSGPDIPAGAACTMRALTIMRADEY
jgi:hypothetical protein